MVYTDLPEFDYDGILLVFKVSL